MLLALAHAKVRQFDEASKHQRNAVAGLKRLGPSDPQTAHELKMLRVEVAEALRAKR